jgi:hypothetical protein
MVLAPFSSPPQYLPQATGECEEKQKTVVKLQGRAIA